MNHINEDKLLEYALELITDKAERNTIGTHLQQCSTCHSAFTNIQNDIRVISSVRPRSAAMANPNKRENRNILWPLLRAAALIAFGISVGYGASTWTHKEPSCISPAYMTFDTPENATTGLAVSDATEVSAEF